MNDELQQFNERIRAAARGLTAARFVKALAFGHNMDEQIAVNAAWIMLPRTALFLSRMRGTGGNLAYPGMSVKGGELLGLPAITSTAVPGVGSPSAGVIALVDPSEILVADDSGGSFEVSTQASLAMTDESASPGGDLAGLDVADPKHRDQDRALLQLAKNAH
jgi:HK97 family phage major capsid protein